MGWFGDLVGGVVDFVGSALGAVVNAVANVLGPIIGAVAAIIKGVATALGIIKPENDVEEMGARATMTEKKPEDFDSIQAYIDHVKEQPLPEDFETASEKEKLKYKCTGVGMLHMGTEEKLGIEIPVGFWATAKKQGLESDSALQVLETCKEKEVSLGDYSQYLEGKLEGAENARADAQIVDVYKERFPEMDENRIFQAIDSDKDKIQGN